MKKRLHDWLTYVPDTIAPENRRAYHITLIATGIGGPLHLLTLTLFALFDVTPMVYFNIGSVAFYIVIFFLLRQTGQAALYLVVVSIELIIHQVLAVYYLGWGYGFQYFLLASGLVFMGHFRRPVLPAVCVGISLAAFAWLYFYGQYLYQPHLSLPETVRIGLYWWNTTIFGLMFAIAFFVYARTAAHMERELIDQNRQLHDTQMMLVQSEKMAAIGKLAAGLTHEINTPIGAIISGTETGARAVERILKMQETKDGNGNDDQRTARTLSALGQSLQSTVTAAQRLKEVVGRLKGFVRVDEAEVKEANLHEGIENTIALLHDQLQSGPIEIYRHFNEPLPEILCRPAEINQVFMHLLQNAIDAIEGPGTISITTNHDEENVQVAIQDNGRGLSSEACEGLFDPGFTGRSRIKLGMGLPISHQIVTHHRGELQVKSTLGEGTTFTMILPKQMTDE